MIYKCMLWNDRADCCVRRIFIKADDDLEAENKFTDLVAASTESKLLDEYPVLVEEADPAEFAEIVAHALDEGFPCTFIVDNVQRCIPRKGEEIPMSVLKSITQIECNGVNLFK